VARNVLDRIRYLGLLKDRNVDGAAAQLRGAIVRLRRENPFRLQLPRPLKRSEQTEADEE